MTSKRMQLKKTPIYIFFLKKQIPQNFKKIPLEDFTSYSVSKDDDKVLLNLEKISKLNTLQKNYKLFLIGQALSKYCKLGDFFIDYFGCEQTDVKTFIFLVSKILYTMKIEVNFLVYKIKRVMFNIKYDLGDSNVSL